MTDVILLSILVGKRGGVERHVRELYERLMKSDYEAVIITEDSAPSVRCISVGKPKRFSTLWYILSTILVLLKFCSRERVRLFHAHDPYAAFAALIVSKIFRIPTLYTYHAVFLPQELRESGSGVFSSILFFLLSKIAFRHSDAVILWSRSLLRRALLCHGHCKKSFVLPIPISVDFFRGCSKERARKILSLPTDKKILLSVGRLTPQKGFDRLLRAIARLNEKEKNSLLALIIGSGPEERNLLGLCDELGLENVLLLKNVSDGELRLYYAACDFFVLPSRAEGLPLVIVEALSAGKPVIATKVGGIPDVLRNCGVLVDDEESLRQAISILLREEELRDKLSRRAFLEAERHRWERVLESLLKIYASLRERSKARNKPVQFS